MAGLVPEQPKKTMMESQANDNDFFIVVYPFFFILFASSWSFPKSFSYKDLVSMDTLLYL
jgi:hypothetical protein